MKNGGRLLLAVVLLVLMQGMVCAAAEETAFGVVSGSKTVNLRQQPSADSAWLGSYAEGSWVEILSQSGNWYAVTAPDGARGYMSSSYVRRTEDNYAVIGLVKNPEGTSFLNLRATPSYSANVLGIYYNDTPCILLSHSGGWYHVRVNGVEGYFKAEYIQETYRVFSEEVATVDTPKGTRLNLRAGPGKGYTSINQFPGGKYVMVLQRGTDWWRVSVDGYVGFMSTDFLKEGVITPGGTTAEEAVSGGGQAVQLGQNDQSYVIVNNPKSTQVLNFREQPDSESRVIAQYGNGSRLNLIDAGEEWCFVQDAGGVKGYMMTQFLRVYNVNATPVRRVSHPQKSYVNLRAEPSMSGKVLDKVPHGAMVAVLVPGDTWVKVRYNNQTGYMMASFLK